MNKVILAILSLTFSAMPVFGQSFRETASFIITSDERIEINYLGFNVRNTDPPHKNLKFTIVDKDNCFVGDEKIQINFNNVIVSDIDASVKSEYVKSFWDGQMKLEYWWEVKLRGDKPIITGSLLGEQKVWTITSRKPPTTLVTALERMYSSFCSGDKSAF